MSFQPSLTQSGHKVSPSLRSENPIPKAKPVPPRVTSWERRCFRGPSFRINVIYRTIPNPTHKMPNRRNPLRSPSGPRMKRFLEPSRSHDRFGISESIARWFDCGAYDWRFASRRALALVPCFHFFLIDEGFWLRTIWLLPARASRLDKPWSFDRGKYLRQTHYLPVHGLLRKASRPMQVH